MTVVSDAVETSTEDSDTPILVVTDLKTQFAVPAGSVKAVDGVSFSLGRGRTLGVVGESGSGKTVLSRSIMGLNVASNATTTGSVLYDGQELVGRTPKQMKRLWGDDMAMVFQDPMTTLNPVVKVGRQLTEHMRLHLDISKTEARTRAVELLRSVRIPEPDARFENYPHQMSGGMRQRVCIAMALACSPDLLFADEPTTALDVTVQHQILNLLAQQQRERHMTMILVTHDLGVVAGMSDRVHVMYAGRIVEAAGAEDLFRAPEHPYTRGLLASVPRLDGELGSSLASIPGQPPDLAALPPGCAFEPRCAWRTDACVRERPELREVKAEGDALPRAAACPEENRAARPAALEGEGIA